MKKLFSKLIKSTIFAFAFCACLSQSVEAQLYYSTTLTGAAEFPVNNSPGVGLASVTVDMVNSTMRVQCAFTGLVGTVTVSHIHAATATPGTGTAGVATMVPTFTGFPSGVTSGTYDHTFNMTDAASYNPAYITGNGGTAASAWAALSSAIAGGKSYLNVHSSSFTGGEIRGFLAPCMPAGIVSISAAANPVCSNGTTVLTANGVTGTNPVVQWFTQPNGGGTQVGSGLNSNPVGPGTYYARVISPCGNPAETFITIGSKATSSSQETETHCYSFDWHGVTYKKSGDYIYTTTNAAGCDSIITLHLTITSIASVVSNVTNAGCFGSATGSATVLATEGQAPIEYKLGTSGTYSANNLFNNLKAGTYYVYIKDATGCLGLSDPIAIGQQPAITGDAAVTDALCNAGKGTIQITPTSGIPAYEYKLGTAGLFSATNNFVVRAGSYKITVKDGNGCTGIVSAIVGEPGPMVTTLTPVNATCAQRNGSITASTTGGGGGYLYRLGTSGAYQSSNTFTGLKPGTALYRVYTLDMNNCTATPVTTMIGEDPVACRTAADKARLQARASTVTDTKLDAVLSPNPTKASFKLLVKGKPNAEVSIRVMDMNGRSALVTKGFAQQSYTFGQSLAPGLYMIEVKQGTDVKILKGFKIK